MKITNTHFTLWHTIAEMWGHMTATLMPEVACLLHLNWKSQMLCEKRNRERAATNDSRNRGNDGLWENHWVLSKMDPLDSQEASFLCKKQKIAFQTFQKANSMIFRVENSLNSFDKLSNWHYHVFNKGLSQWMTHWAKFKPSLTSKLT